MIFPSYFFNGLVLVGAVNLSVNFAGSAVAATAAVSAGSAAAEEMVASAAAKMVVVVNFILNCLG